ncbi:MAG: methyl-accepting chemotaxis protein [Roseburia sp.]
MEEKRLSDAARSNRLGIICHTIMAVLICIFYVKELVTGERNILYVGLIFVLALAPVIAEFIFYGKNPDTGMVKHLVGYGYAVLYTVIMFTSNNNMVFVFVIPMILCISIFSDFAYSTKISIGVIIENLLVTVLGGMTGKFGYAGLNTAVIQVAIMTIICINSVAVSKVAEKMNQEKMEEIANEHTKTEGVLSNVMTISEGMTKGIEVIYKKVDHLKEAASTTQLAMKQVSVGSTDTAEAVQKQLKQTEAIQSKVGQVSEASDIIEDSMQKTMEALVSGNEKVSQLVSQVETSVESSADVADKLETLDSYMEEMNSIVELISGITSQTSLLALNASIEAARAGEAGKGFAVVATEISGMATQTKEATEHITKLIQDVSGAITQVVDVVRLMIGEIQEEKNTTNVTAESFHQIEESTNVIRQHISNLAIYIKDLESSNQEIAETVQTISAISEEVSAHANETYESEVENAGILEEIADITDRIKEYTKQLWQDE